jgi:Protein of unknown function (DUF3306)
MTSPENFVSRWARLKSESDTKPKTDPVGHGPRQEAVASVGTETPSLRQKDEAAEEPFDPASLPSIETITLDTDIRGFLQSRVPAALTRAALRRAWASDPAIRDFIGIAENQWDFNDPTAIHGFGPMLETDKLPALLARALGGHDKLADIIPEIPTVVENALQVGTGSARTDLERSLQRMPERSVSSVGMCNLLDDGQESTATGNERFAEEDGSSRSHRSHGSALPR